MAEDSKYFESQPKAGGHRPPLQKAVDSGPRPMESHEQTGLSRWWRVVGALSMNFALGTLYAWSVFVAPLEAQFGWKRADTSLVFTVAVIVFALTFVLAGRIQDRFG